MKLKFFTIFLLLFLITPFFHVGATDNAVGQRLKGRILLQVESHGEAWYVEPKSGERYYMANGNEAYRIMRELGVGITNTDLEKAKLDVTFAKKHSGKIFLQVESHGEAYYVDIYGALHYLKDGITAYDVMRNLGLGITNENLAQITVASLVDQNSINTVKEKNVSNVNVFSKRISGKGNFMSENFYSTSDKIKVSYTFNAKASSYGFFYGEQGVDGHDFVIIDVSDDENKKVLNCQDFENFDNTWTSYFVCKTGVGNFHINIKSKATTDWVVNIESYK